MRENINAKMVKFKMHDPNIVSTHFLLEDQENRSSKLQIMFSKSHGCQEENRTQKIIDLTCRPNLLPTVLPQTSPKEHKSLETLPSKLIQV